MSRLWPDTFVEENNLTQHISMLRRALGEGPGQSGYIETVPKLGYRFVVPVREVSGSGDAEFAPRRRTRMHIVVHKQEEEVAETEAAEGRGRREQNRLVVAKECAGSTMDCRLSAGGRSGAGDRRLRALAISTNFASIQRAADSGSSSLS